MTDHPRRAIIKLSQQELEFLIRLPDGLRIVGVRDDWTFHGVAVLIEGDALEPVDPALVPPVVRGGWEYDSDTGRMWWLPPFEPKEAP